MHCHIYKTTFTDCMSVEDVLLVEMAQVERIPEILGLQSVALVSLSFVLMKVVMTWITLAMPVVESQAGKQCLEQKLQLYCTFLGTQKGIAPMCATSGTLV